MLFFNTVIYPFMSLQSSHTQDKKASLGGINIASIVSHHTHTLLGLCESDMPDAVVTDLA